MQFDENNPVVKLCVAGMNAEARGEIEEAKLLFRQAWDSAENNFEKFTAAHYLARNQSDPSEELKWNLAALSFAKAIPGDSMTGHFSSLYLNIGKSYEALGDIGKANKNYQLALHFSSFLPAGAYGDLIRSGISGRLKSTGSSDNKLPELDELINKWCGQKELKPLSLVLPSYLANLGSTNDVNKLISALSFLSSTRCLSNDDQVKIDQIIRELSETESE